MLHFQKIDENSFKYTNTLLIYAKALLVFLCFNLQNLQKADILGVIEGGQISSERQRSARETALRPVAGFVLDALIADQQIEDKWELVNTVMVCY